MKHQKSLDQFVRDMELRNLSSSTIYAYKRNLQKFFHYFNSKELTDITGKDIKDFLHWHLRYGGYSASYVKGLNATIRLFYKHTAAFNVEFERFPIPKRPKKLPVVLSQEEIKTVIQNTRHLKHRAILCTIYTGGLRISELLKLQIKDIDSERMQIRVRGGKGQKDRYTLLSKHCLKLLRDYWLACRPSKWLFEGTGDNPQYSSSSVRKILQKSLEISGIQKPITIHSLRHSFATHLLENGVDIVHISKLMGHTSIKTTMIYLHVRTLPELAGNHPLDDGLADLV